MSKQFQVSANGTTFGIYATETAQEARDLCAVDAGYKSEADMVAQLEQASELVAEEVVINFEVLDASEENTARFQADPEDYAAIREEGEIAAWVDDRNPNRSGGYSDYVAYLPSCGRAAHVSNGDVTWYDAESLKNAVEQIQTGAELVN